MEAPRTIFVDGAVAVVVDFVAPVDAARRREWNARRNVAVHTRRYGALTGARAARERPELVHLAVAVVVDLIARLVRDVRPGARRPGARDAGLGSAATARSSRALVALRAARAASTANPSEPTGCAARASGSAAHAAATRWTARHAAAARAASTASASSARVRSARASRSARAAGPARPAGATPGLSRVTPGAPGCVSALAAVFAPTGARARSASTLTGAPARTISRSTTVRRSATGALARLTRTCLTRRAGVTARIRTVVATTGNGEKQQHAKGRAKHSRQYSNSHAAPKASLRPPKRLESTRAELTRLGCCDRNA